MVEYADVFGENLRRIREEKKISRQELEQKTGIPAVTLAGYENAFRTPNFKNLVSIADTLKVTTDELLGRNEFFKRVTEKKNLEFRLKRAETLMTLLGLCVYGEGTSNGTPTKNVRIDFTLDESTYKKLMDIKKSFYDDFSIDELLNHAITCVAEKEHWNDIYKVPVWVTFDSYSPFKRFNENNIQGFDGILEFVEFVESMERKAVREKKTFEEVFFEATGLKNNEEKEKNVVI